MSSLLATARFCRTVVDLRAASAFLDGVPAQVRAGVPGVVAMLGGSSVVRAVRRGPPPDTKGAGSRGFRPQTLG